MFLKSLQKPISNTIRIILKTIRNITSSSATTTGRLLLSLKYFKVLNLKAVVLVAVVLAVVVVVVAAVAVVV